MAGQPAEATAQYPAVPVAAPAFAPPVALPPPPPKRSKATWVFGAFVVLLLAAGGVLTTVYVSYRSESNRTLNEQQAQIADLQSKVDGRAETLKRREEDLSQARKAADDATKRVNDMAGCPAAVQAFIDELKNGTNSSASQALVNAMRVCGTRL